MSNSEEAYQTGLETLDSELPDGGFSPGSVISVLGSPMSVSETLIYNMTGGRRTVYLSSIRDPDSIADTLKTLYPDGDTIDIEYVNSMSASEILNTIREYENLEGGNIVIDPVNKWEGLDTNDYISLVHKLRTIAKERQCLVYLHSVQTGDDSATSESSRWVGLQASDIIMNVKYRDTQEEIRNELVIPKIYGSQELEDRKYSLSQNLQIKVSTKQSVGT